MKTLITMLLTFAMACALSGCSGDADKGITQHKEKPVHPAPVKPADGDKK